MKIRILALLAFALVATACSGNVFDLAVGDCFDDPGNFEEVSNVPMVECSRPHHNEVYFLYDLPAGSYPGDDRVAESADSVCLDRFDSFVGTDYEASVLDYAYFVPTRDTWGQGDRKVICLVYHLEGEKLRGTARNSRT
jgi:hypothetical protein